MLDINKFKPITLSDRPVFESFYSKFPPVHSENLFSVLLSWTNFSPSFYLIEKDNLIIMNLKDGKPKFRPPIGEKNDALLKEFIELAKTGADSPIILIEESEKKWISDYYPDIKFIPDRNYFDYVYLTKNLADLPGRNYMGQRNHINNFNNKYKYSIEPISPANKAEISAFLERWCLLRDCESESLLEAEKTAIIYSIDNFFKLNLSGIILKIEGEVEALSIFEHLNNETAVVHFEKAMPGFNGIYQVINNETAKLVIKYKFLNREADLGISGLRTAKQRLHPDHLVKVYFIQKESLLLLK